MSKRALITGITGQDGSYLAGLLLSKNYKVFGMVRHVALENQDNHLTRIRHLLDNPSLMLCQATLENYPSICRILSQTQPDEVYHLAAQSFVSYSFEDEHSTMGININGTHFLLSACQQIVPRAKFYFAGSSEMFGKVAEVPQTERTPFHPRSPYGISKVDGFNLTRYYREHKEFQMFALSGILFNHESPRRGREFVSRKITHTAARIYHGQETKLLLGNPDAQRDWGFAPDYVEAMWRMLQQDQPDDFVIATGETHSVREFVQRTFDHLNLPVEKHVTFNNPRDMRPSEVDLLKGDATKARRILGWKPIVSFAMMVKIMVENDLQLVKSKK